MRRKSPLRDTTTPRAFVLQFQAKLSARSLLRLIESATMPGRNARAPRLVLRNDQGKKDCPPLCSADLACYVDSELGRKIGAARMLPLPTRRVPKCLCCRRRGAWTPQATRPALKRESDHPAAPCMIARSKPHRL